MMGDQEVGKVIKIALTGGPCGGKSTALKKLSEHMGRFGVKVILVPEAATIVLTAGGRFHSQMDVKECVAIQSAIMKTQMGLEDALTEYAREVTPPGSTCVLICDRGAMDCRAYSSDQVWSLILDSNGWSDLFLRDERYFAVVHMVTAADGNSKFYTTGNNAVRRETPEEAVVIDQKLKECWLGHARLRVVGNEEKFETKVQRVVSFISHIVAIPDPSNTHRKFSISSISDTKDWPVPFNELTLTQTYLVPHETTNSSIRLECKTQNGSNSYFTSTKRECDNEFVVSQSVITPRQYAAMLSQADPNRIPVVKHIYCFLWENVYCQVVSYTQPSNVAPFLEVVTDKPFTLPPWLVAAGPTAEITENEKYTSFWISQKSQTSCR